MPKTNTIIPTEISSLLKQLRPYLPGKVVKTSPFSYLVADGRVIVQLDYYCSWKNREEKSKTCLPHCIKVIPSADYVDKHISNKSYYHSSSPSSICGVRVFRKRVDNSFNLEGIAVAITKVSEAVDSYIVELKKRKEKLAEIRKQEEKNLRLLNEILNTYDKHDKYSVQVENRSETNRDLLRYQVRINQISEETLHLILSILEKESNKES